MTKTLLVAALAAFLLTPAAVTSHAAGYAGADVYAAGAGGTSKCDSITDPVKKQQCMKSQSQRDGQLKK